LKIFIDYTVLEKTNSMKYTKKKQSYLSLLLMNDSIKID